MSSKMFGVISCCFLFGLTLTCGLTAKYVHRHLTEIEGSCDVIETINTYEQLVAIVTFTPAQVTQTNVTSFLITDNLDEQSFSCKFYPDSNEKIFKVEGMLISPLERAELLIGVYVLFSLISIFSFVMAIRTLKN